MSKGVKAITLLSKLEVIQGFMKSGGKVRIGEVEERGGSARFRENEALQAAEESRI